MVLNRDKLKKPLKGICTPKRKRRGKRLNLWLDKKRRISYNGKRVSNL